MAMANVAIPSNGYLDKLPIPTADNVLLATKILISAPASSSISVVAADGPTFAFKTLGIGTTTVTISEHTSYRG